MLTCELFAVAFVSHKCWLIADGWLDESKCLLCYEVGFPLTFWIPFSIFCSCHVLFIARRIWFNAKAGIDDSDGVNCSALILFICVFNMALLRYLNFLATRPLLNSFNKHTFIKRSQSEANQRPMTTKRQ